MLLLPTEIPFQHPGPSVVAPAGTLLQLVAAGAVPSLAAKGSLTGTIPVTGVAGGQALRLPPVSWNPPAMPIELAVSVALPWRYKRGVRVGAQGTASHPQFRRFAPLCRRFL